MGYQRPVYHFVCRGPDRLIAAIHRVLPGGFPGASWHRARHFRDEVNASLTRHCGRCGRWSIGPHLTSSLLLPYNRFCGGAQLWSPQHDLLGSFDHLCRNRPFVCGDSGMDRASLDPKALLA
jgi:hypothetical protein